MSDHGPSMVGDLSWERHGSGKAPRKPYDGSQAPDLVDALAAANARIAELERSADNQAYGLLMRAYDGCRDELDANRARLAASEARVAELREATDILMPLAEQWAGGGGQNGPEMEDIRRARALLDQQPGRAAALADQCTRALDCTQRAGHDGWCTVVLISEGRRCQAKEGRAKCWRPAGHDGVHEDRALRWDHEHPPAAGQGEG